VLLSGQEGISKVWEVGVGGGEEEQHKLEHITPEAVHPNRSINMQGWVHAREDWGDAR
jgi:hypothetical protein